MFEKHWAKYPVVPNIRSRDILFIPFQSRQKFIQQRSTLCLRCARFFKRFQITGASGKLIKCSTMSEMSGILRRGSTSTIFGNDRQPLIIFLSIIYKSPRTKFCSPLHPSITHFRRPWLVTHLGRLVPYIFRWRENSSNHGTRKWYGLNS